MYLFDANVFIDANRRYYPLDIAPSFWTWLDEQFQMQRVASISSVYDELKRMEDSLTSWAQRPQLQGAWLPPNAAAIENATELVEWAKNPESSFQERAIEEFAASADLWLIAQAAAGQHTIVTHEQSSPNAKRKIFIPDAAVQLGVPCANPFDVFRQLGLHL
ncbi:DUF4411 family protein [Corynebacterium lizhenjunii]|uniref:DUF4411 family protein n=1 Tax=Corynebacterium lizhenjunii TaxID=2709394 RepID=UPI0013ED94A6|nr:DUF4411 family protein [Corynebacterium lizhenjunii]